MTKEEALEKISEYSNAFKNMFSYHNDKEVALAAVKRNGLVLDCCSKELKDDFDIVLAAVSNNGVSIKYASDNLKDNKKIVDGLKKGIADNTGIKNYIDAGLNFRYIVHSHKNPQEVLFEHNFNNKEVK